MSNDTRHEEHILNTDDNEPGCEMSRLQAWLQRVATERGHTEGHLAEILCVRSAPFWRLGVGLDVGETLRFARACAKYLNVSTLQILLVSGKLDALDAAPAGLTTTHRTLIQVGTGCFDDVLVPKIWQPFVPPALWDAPLSVRKRIQQSIHDAGSKQFSRLSILLCDFLALIQSLREQDVAKDWYQAAESAAKAGHACVNEVEEDMSWM